MYILRTSMSQTVPLAAPRARTSSMTANDDELVPAAWVEDLPFHDESPDISDIAGRRIREIVERAAMDRHRGMMIPRLFNDWG